MPLKVAGEMAQGLRMLGVFQEDPGLIPRTYAMTYIHLQL